MRLLNRGVAVLLWGLTLAAVMLFAVHAAGLLRAPAVAVEYGEGTLANYVVLLAEGGEYALPIDEPPWVHATYPPLVPLAALVMPGEPLLALRWLHYLATLAAASLLAWLLLGERLGAWAATLGALALLVARPVHGFAPLGRVDAVALCLALAGLALGLRRRPLAAGVLLGLGLLAKPTALAAPAALLLAALAGRRRREALLLAGSVVLVAGGGFLAWNLHSEGQAWLHMTRYAGAAGFSPGALARGLAGFCLLNLVALPLALWSGWQRRRTPLGLWGLLALLGVLWLGKPGSTSNVLLESCAALIVLAAPLLWGWWRHGSPGLRLLALLLALAQLGWWVEPERPARALATLAGPELGRLAVVEAIDESSGEVLVEEPGLALAAGKPVEIQPFQFGLLARSGLWDPAPLIERVRTQHYGLVVTGFRLEGLPGLVPALEQSYLPVVSYDGLQLWYRRRLDTAPAEHGAEPATDEGRRPATSGDDTP